MSESEQSSDTQIVNGITITDIDKAVEHMLDTRVVDEEYKMWKKNTPFLYDIIMNTVLPQVSLTVEWFPEVTEVPGKDISVQRVLMGTQTHGEDLNTVTISEVRFPTNIAKINTLGSYNGKGGKVEVVQTILHKDHVHKAKYIPQNPNLIVTKSPSADVYAFDRTKHSSKPTLTDTFAPNLVLTGHKTGGYGLDVSNVHEGYILSGSDDGSINLWNINGVKASVSSMAPYMEFTNEHTKSISALKFHPSNGNQFASVGVDSQVVLWDIREQKCTSVHSACHTGDINDLSFNQHDENVFVTCGSDKTVKMWDIRSMSTPLHTFTGGHSGEVFNVEFAPFSSSILASSGDDRRVCIWDIASIGEEQSAEDAEDGPPELMFTHAGHTDKVNGISWSLAEDWLLASIADDEVLQVWQVAAVLREEEDEEEEYEDEE